MYITKDTKFLQITPSVLGPLGSKVIYIEFIMSSSCAFIWNNLPAGIESITYDVHKMFIPREAA